MKANEAPEKIYRATTCLDGDRGKTFWKENPVAGAKNIEYIRTDTFIEKAVDWLTKNAENYIWYSDYAESPGDDTCGMDDDFVKDFANYMKGIV